MTTNSRRRAFARNVDFSFIVSGIERTFTFRVSLNTLPTLARLVLVIVITYRIQKKKPALCRVFTINIFTLFDSVREKEVQSTRTEFISVNWMYVTGYYFVNITCYIVIRRDGQNAQKSRIS